MLGSLAAVLLLASQGSWAALDFRAAEALEARFAGATRRVEADIPAFKAARESVLDAPDPETRIKAAEALFHRMRRDLIELDGLRDSHDTEVSMLAVQAVSRGLDLGRGRPKDKGPEEAEFDAIQAFDARMKGKTYLLLGAVQQEEREFARVLQALELRKKARRRRRLGAGAAAVLCAGAALLWRRTRAPAPPSAALPAEPAPPSIPALVAGNYRVLRLVGRGAMGEVFEAVDLTLERRAALKRLLPTLLQDPVELEGLLTEARLMASLKHPNLVAIYSVEKDAGQVFLALEFVDGASLQRRLDVERSLSWPEALRIARGVGAALDYAHGMKVVHRDLKPSNIMLSSKGEVKVTDFGIAYQAAKSVSRLTRAPTWGTPPYMAPEQELGGISAAVDIYALAVCLYEMLTGELPFKGPNFLAQKREALWIPPSRVAPGLPAGADALFAAALAPEPSRRFKSAAALLAACDAL